MSETHAGGCLCGAVRFVVEGAFDRFFLCHCSRCRKGTGTAHAANLFSGSARLRWLAGEELIRCYTVPGARHTRCFCTRCGSTLPKVKPGDGTVVVPAGSLDTPLALRPVAPTSAWTARPTGTTPWKPSRSCRGCRGEARQGPPAGRACPTADLQSCRRIKRIAIRRLL
jgi:hypothetical protein